MEKSRGARQGGQATVFSVKDTTGALKGTYALKPLKPDADTQAYKRFQDEVSAIKGVDHPNIIKIIESSKPEDAFHYYVMEFHKDAQSLKSLLRSSNNPFHNDALKSLNLFRQLVSVIEAIKGAGIVHRDLSPGNVLILPNETLKVIDFGICQIEDDETRITLVDEGLGTRNYTAPELEAGAGGTASFKSDLYSAGKILWSAVTNRLAFAKEKLVFNNLSMYKLGLDVMTWHLHHIFEGTIRDNPDHRFDSPNAAMEKVMLVNGAINMKGFPFGVTGFGTPL